MYLSVDETAALLGVSAKWVRERIDAGDSLLSKHLKCRRRRSAETTKSRIRRPDRSPVRISSQEVAAYIRANTREHAWAAFPTDTALLPPGIEPGEPDEVELRIWKFLVWYRNKPLITEQATKPASQPQS